MTTEAVLRREEVPAAFDSGAAAYDRLVGANPGYHAHLHEYSVRDSLRARAMWNAVCWSVIIPSGRLAAGDASLYRYLWRSVEGFDGVRRFRRRLREAGFTGVQTETMTGWQRDVVHTFLASAPPVTTAGTPPDAASAPPVTTAGTPPDAASAPPVTTAGTPPDAASAPPVTTGTG